MPGQGEACQDGGSEEQSTDLGPPTDHGAQKPTGSGWHSPSILQMGSPHHYCHPGQPDCCYLSPGWERVSQHRLPLLHPPYRLPKKVSCENEGRTWTSFAQPPTQGSHLLRIKSTLLLSVPQPTDISSVYCGVRMAWPSLPVSSGPNLSPSNRTPLSPLAKSSPCSLPPGPWKAAL